MQYFDIFKTRPDISYEEFIEIAHIRDNVNKPDEKRFSAFEAAIEAKAENIAISLLNNGARIYGHITPSSTIYHIIMYGMTELGRKIFDDIGVNINFYPHDYEFPLVFMAKTYDMVDLFINRNADFSLKDPNNSNILHHRAFYPTDVSALSKLLDLGININELNYLGETPLMCALNPFIPIRTEISRFNEIEQKVLLFLKKGALVTDSTIYKASSLRDIYPEDYPYIFDALKIAKILESIVNSGNIDLNDHVESAWVELFNIIDYNSEEFSFVSERVKNLIIKSRNPEKSAEHVQNYINNNSAAKIVEKLNQAIELYNENNSLIIPMIAITEADDPSRAIEVHTSLPEINTNIIADPTGLYSLSSDPAASLDSKSPLIGNTNEGLWSFGI